MSSAQMRTGWLSRYYLAKITVSDTQDHNYLTDPYNENTDSGIKIVPVGNQVPEIKSWGIFILNNSNEDLDVQVIGATPEFEKNGFFPLTSFVTVSSGSQGFIVLSSQPVPVPDVSINFYYSSTPSEILDKSLKYGVISMIFVHR